MALAVAILALMAAPAGPSMDVVIPTQCEGGVHGPRTKRLSAGPVLGPCVKVRHVRKYVPLCMYDWPGRSSTVVSPSHFLPKHGQREKTWERSVPYVPHIDILYACKAYHLEGTAWLFARTSHASMEMAFQAIDTPHHNHTVDLPTKGSRQFRNPLEKRDTVFELLS